jgi:protoheme IX farnesyltransferase
VIGRRDALLLARPRVGALVAAAALFGAALRAPGAGGGGDGLWASGTLAAAGAFALCAGCSALNQVQERATDRRMTRTADRPVAAGRLSPARGAALGVAWALGGLILLGTAGSVGAGIAGAGVIGAGVTGAARLAGAWPPVAVGLVVLAVYNGLYTPLKRRTHLAVLVGAVAGALPPLTGWLATGGAPDARILAATALYYLWQGPHFWLLAERHRADYARAGLPTAPAALPAARYRVVMAVWVMAFFVGAACAVAPGLAASGLAGAAGAAGATGAAGAAGAAGATGAAGAGPLAAAAVALACPALGAAVCRWSATGRTRLALAAFDAAIVLVMAAMVWAATIWAAMPGGAPGGAILL